jgi:hypothetical protein
VAEKKAFLLRIDSRVLEAVQRWAGDDLRSLNAHIEFLLRRSLQQAGRAKASDWDQTPSDPSDPSSRVE